MAVNKTVEIPLSELRNNEGQIEGVPQNPRQVTVEEFEALVRSIQDDPTMLYMRELDVYKHGNAYVVLNGNQRLRALRRLEYKKAPCKIIPESATPEQLRAYVIKDNEHFGKNDRKTIEEEWSEFDLSDYGVDNLKEGKEPTEDKEDEEKKVEFTLTFSADQFKYVKQRLNEVDKDNAKALVQILMEYQGGMSDE